MTFLRDREGNELPDAADAVRQFPFIECQPFHDGRSESGCFAAARSIPLAANIFLFLLPDFNHVKERGISFSAGADAIRGDASFIFAASSFMLMGILLYYSLYNICLS